VDGGEGEGLACVGSLRYRYRSVPMQASASPSHDGAAGYVGGRSTLRTYPPGGQCSAY
jgi:hypothetical protein